MNIGYAQFEYELIISAAWIIEKLRRAASVQSAEGNNIIQTIIPPNLIRGEPSQYSNLFRNTHASHTKLTVEPGFLNSENQGQE